MQFPGSAGEFLKAESSLAFILFLNNLLFAQPEHGGCFASGA